MLNAKEARQQFLATHKVAIAEAQQNFPAIFEIIEQRLNQAIAGGLNYFIIEESELESLTFKDHLMYHLLHTLDYGCKTGVQNGVEVYRIGFDNRPEEVEDDENHSDTEVRHIRSIEDLMDLPDEVKAGLMQAIMRGGL